MIDDKLQREEFYAFLRCYKYLKIHFGNSDYNSYK